MLDDELNGSELTCNTARHFYVSSMRVWSSFTGDLTCLFSQSMLPALSRFNPRTCCRNQADPEHLHPIASSSVSSDVQTSLPVLRPFSTCVVLCPEFLHATVSSRENQRVVATIARFPTWAVFMLLKVPQPRPRRNGVERATDTAIVQVSEKTAEPRNFPHTPARD